MCTLYQLNETNFENFYSTIYKITGFDNNLYFIKLNIFLLKY